jgi:hypothetical protein
MTPISGGLVMPSDPHLWRWMLFVDGENLTIRAQAVQDEYGFKLEEGTHYKKDVFVWMPGIDPLLFASGSPATNLQTRAIRAYYYTSYTGADDDQRRLAASLWELNFNPAIFKKDKATGKSKGVDIT